MAPAPQGVSAHVSAAFHVYANRSICVAANCPQRAKFNILVGTTGAGAQSTAKNPREERGTLGTGLESEETWPSPAACQGPGEGGKARCGDGIAPFPLGHGYPYWGLHPARPRG